MLANADTLRSKLCTTWCARQIIYRQDIDVCILLRLSPTDGNNRDKDY